MEMKIFMNFQNAHEGKTKMKDEKEKRRIPYQ